MAENNNTSPCRAGAAIAAVSNALRSRARNHLIAPEAPIRTKIPSPESVDTETVLYLAYGSNLSNETFRGSRGITPLSQINVQVPSLRLTFDLPGIPYIEPCFANTARRDPSKDVPESRSTYGYSDEKPLLPPVNSQKDKYHKDRWHKGLIGVVYEVTKKDYAHIIATEGGGSSYQDILVDCHPFYSIDPSEPVPQNPTLPSFKAHTLFAPARVPGEGDSGDGGRNQRPDTSYAQASARYLKLLTDGAAELGLPYEYQDYLHSLRPYTITTWRQRIGQMLFMTLWLPIIALFFGLSKIFADENGRLPDWLRAFSVMLFKAVWFSYDVAFKRNFGDGERTQSGDDDDNDLAEEAGVIRQQGWRSAESDTNSVKLV